MNITITGNLGSGKSSVCDYLQKQGVGNETGFTEFISTGKIFREVAAQKGISVLELNELAKTDRSVDVMIDEKTAQLGKEKDNIVFDSRMAWYFVPDSFKVFLLVDTDEAARRVFADHTRDTEKYATKEDAVKSLYERAMLEQKRFLDMYNVDYLSAQNFNLIIDSTGATPKQVVAEILRNLELYKKRPFQGKVELCISNIYPTKSFRDFSPIWLQKCVDQETLCNTGLCSSEVIPVIQKNGYVYMLDGHHKTFAAASTGKVFVEVGMITGFNKSILPLSAGQLYDFEDWGHFRYQFYPDKTPERTGYLFDFGQKEKKGE